MTDPLVSVCLITYNHKRYIGKAIESVLSQKHVYKWEFIIADDCSTDGTTDILREYQEKYPELIKLIIQHVNVGPARNWFDLVTAAKGKYIAYFEGDDYWTDDNKISKQISFLENNPDYEVCFHDSYEIDSSGQQIVRFDLNSNQKEVCSLEDLSKGNFIYTASSVFRNPSFETLPKWFHQLNAGDYTLHMLLAEKGKLRFINEKMSAYRIHDSGVFTNAKARTLYLGNIHMLRFLIKHFKGKNSVCRNLYRQVRDAYGGLLYKAYDDRNPIDYFGFLARYIQYAMMCRNKGNLIGFLKLIPHLFRRIWSAPKHTL